MASYTELTRKEQGRIRYAKQQARHRVAQGSRTRPSDTSGPKRIGDGLAGWSPPQSAFVSRFPPPKGKRKALPMDVLQLLLEATAPQKGTK